MSSAALSPDTLPRWMLARRDERRVTVCHNYPDDWDQAQLDLHRYDDCPCVPLMRQELGTGIGYQWQVVHRRRLVV